MKLTIREMDWYKRRPPVREPKPAHVEIPDLQLKDEHRCDMFVTYDSGERFCLSGRVNQNSVLKTWAVHGIDHKGHQCMVDVEEVQKCIYCGLEYGYHDNSCPQRDLTHLADAP